MRNRAYARGLRLLPGAVVAAVAAVVLAGCGTGPTPVGTSGVDELTVPSPSPDPADFVVGVDSAWWPLATGDVAVFRDGAGRELRRTVAAPTQLAGVSAVPVTTEPVLATWPAGQAPPVTTDWYAQDRRGNVWLVGGTGTDGATWTIGSAGPPAGLVVTAVPRVGDGYVRRAPEALGSLPGLRVRVLDTSGVEELGDEELETTVLEVVAGAESVADSGSAVDEEVLGRGVGLVRFTADGVVWSRVDR
ncbi:hypothetical protein RDV89_06815 [Nocardioides zeae]|uniref:Uncharacterized protein n=1 Tax=Nocardioides imazamoxiresistens TaxID=3231893 RepID=A0ABU3PU71_9ACTN|nr:hypothetical protein [Nocardioides zeae]MDT9592771.1 hypothetical protein [Nocardioides zeae]